MRTTVRFCGAVLAVLAFACLVTPPATEVNRYLIVALGLFLLVAK